MTPALQRHLAPARERPILFSAPMVRAILAGRKTQTRRLVRIREDGTKYDRSPYGAPGERLWVRETFRVVDHGRPSMFYRADEEWHKGAGWKPAIHMPRWVSRIDLEVTGVRVEHLQDISEADARAEGVANVNDHRCYPSKHAAWVKTYRRGFEEAWDAINGKRAAWATNPWVWVVSFRRAS